MSARARERTASGDRERPGADAGGGRAVIVGYEGLDRVVAMARASRVREAGRVLRQRRAAPRWHVTAREQPVIRCAPAAVHVLVERRNAAGRVPGLGLDDLALRSRHTPSRAPRILAGGGA